MKRKEKDRLSKRLARSKAYRIAYRDHEFLDTGYARPIRLQTELMKPEYIFQNELILSTIVVFGGTRIIERAKAKRRVRRLEHRLAQKPGDRDLRRKLRIARSILRKSEYYEQARLFGRLVSEEGQRHQGHEYVIVTGGGPGVMEAANRGAFDIGAKSIGLNITLPREQEPNPYITPELCLQFHYYGLRKMHFMLRAKALVAFPGGYGTLDELFEALTLVQTKKVSPMPIILFGEKYWRGLINFDYLVEEGTIDEKDRDLFVFCDKAADAWQRIRDFWTDQPTPHTAAGIS
jgi:uncharacterized protein (TIGR00730 family)